MEPVPSTEKKAASTGDVERADDETFSVVQGDVLSLEHTDPVLNAKMHMINDVSEWLAALPHSQNVSAYI